ncbi:class I SAM-dependent methyltransferase [Candidatus Frankia alpina]|uniref:Class I SAM-dependent methyltransferase n=1 Tax=Candidatus Frankia alpina TaxID=2699483 RepID=A0A4S5EST3_9ACTN|nr:class I SAM-dependent methyltransferase [Candidatus Frankia alpina]THJ75501.1 class I SAM-dependent methyltransferase [Candidatus Frankia alpina]
MTQFHFDPRTYRAMVVAEVPHYERLQDEVATATAGRRVTRMLDLGVGTGETSGRVLDVHPDAALVAIDESPAMLEAARPRLPPADLRVGRLEDPLPADPFDLVISALAVHHLDEPGKVELFGRIAAVLPPGGRFVLADVVMPDDPVDAVTPVDGIHDKPSRLPDQLGWLQQAGFDITVTWQHRDLAVVAADRPPR